MKYKYRDIKIFTKNIPTLKFENILFLNDNMYKEIYKYENFKKIKYEKINGPKNIFQEYNIEIYHLYKEISKLLNDACKYYSIDQERQNYFIKGKIFEYSKDHNNEVFDFPGKDIPIFHGFVILGEEGLKQTYYTDKGKEEFIFNKNTITLSSPTNLINSKVNNSCKVIEYYLSPLSSIIQNEKNLWIPIL
jgi:hypothetical protein